MTKTTSALSLLYESIYIVVSDVYVLFEFFVSWWVYLNLKVVDLYHAYVVRNDYEYITKTLKDVKKLPLHVTVLLGNETPSYEDLAKLTLWSAAAGVSFISFYDHKGILKKNEEKLQHAIDNCNPDHINVIWYNNRNICKNGIIDRKIYIRTLSYSDGREKVAYITRMFCTDDSRIDIQSIDKKLRDNFTFPDPDLGLYCDNIFSICGYPPWQIRITEFIPLGTHHNIGSQRFIRALHRYSKVEQRLGK